MAVVRRIRNRGATITVEANAEVLFMPSGAVHNWTNRFTGRIRARTIAAAPTNKRPRWGHYGKPLKDTIVSARPRFWSNGRDRQRVYAAVGAKAPHAYYVDQGTGVFAGRGPYEARVLPPWTEGGASLYERTWRPGGPGTRRVSPVMIRGQKGQHFFDKGLRDAFLSMRLRSGQVANEARLGAVLGSMPTGLLGFLGNTPNSPAFRASLAEWRKWRDAAWEAGEGLGRGGGIGSRAHAKHMEKAHTARAKKRVAAKKTASAPKKPVRKPDPPAKISQAEKDRRHRVEVQKRERAALTEFIKNKFPGSKVHFDTLELHHVGNRYVWSIVVTVNGTVHRYQPPSSLR